MKLNKSKRGISLIVLVITIVVMIILATAIILSLAGSDIRGKANEAVSSTDIATAKEIVSVAQSEWELDYEILTQKYNSFSEYALEKLKNAGINTESIYISEDGKVMFGVIAGTTSSIAKEIPIGAKVEGYTLTKKSDYVTDGKETSGRALDYTIYEEVTVTGEAQTIKMSPDLSWKYMGVDENGNALIVADVNEALPKVNLKLQGALVYGLDLLDNVCSSFYSTDKGTARNMKIEDVSMVLNYTGPLVYHYEYEEYELSPATSSLSVGADWRPGKVFNVSDDRFSLYNYYPITIDSKYISCNNEELKMVFQNSSYFLSSHTIVNAPYDWTYPNYGVRIVENNLVGEKSLFMTNWSEWYENGEATYKIRPVVTLKATTQALYNAETNTLTIQ